MAGPRVTPTQMGMMYGIVAGAGIGVVMFALSGDVLWLVLAGVGVALGLGVGASVEQRRRRSAAGDGMIGDDRHRDDAGAHDGQRNDPAGGTGTAR